MLALFMSNTVMGAVRRSRAKPKGIAVVFLPPDPLAAIPACGINYAGDGDGHTCRSLAADPTGETPVPLQALRCACAQDATAAVWTWSDLKKVFPRPFLP
jgi:hypothetical protein